MCGSIKDILGLGMVYTTSFLKDTGSQNRGAKALINKTKNGNFRRTIKWLRD